MKTYWKILRMTDEDLIDLRTGKPVKKICCYKCESASRLCVEEKRREDTGEIIEKNFICIKCAGLFQE
jgi:hypothetical protein